MTTAPWNESRVASAGPHLHFLIDLQPLWVFCMEEQRGRASGRRRGSASFRTALSAGPSNFHASLEIRDFD